MLLSLIFNSFSKKIILVKDKSQSIYFLINNLQIKLQHKKLRYKYYIKTIKAFKPYDKIDIIIKNDYRIAKLFLYLEKNNTYKDLKQIFINNKYKKFHPLIVTISNNNINNLDNNKIKRLSNIKI